MLEVLALIGTVLGVIAVALAVIAALSFRQFCREEDDAFEVECAEFWQANDLADGRPTAP
jgi:biopolymer transport protein ExbB/TolQ